MTNIIRKICAFAVLLPVQMVLADRLMVPDYLTCDRNQITSWTGSITDYQHSAGTTEFTVKTNDGTVEVLSLAFSDESELMEQYRLNGKPFVLSDWKLIEATNKQLITGTRATVWLCLDDSVAPVVNWKVQKEGLSTP